MLLVFIESLLSDERPMKKGAHGCFNIASDDAVIKNRNRKLNADVLRATGLVKNITLPTAPCFVISVVLIPRTTIVTDKISKL